jgi:hypothetical protein
VELFFLDWCVLYMSTMIIVVAKYTACICLTLLLLLLF